MKIVSIRVFVFFDQEAHPSYEQHIQRVYDPHVITQWCEEAGFRLAFIPILKSRGSMKVKNIFMYVKGSLYDSDY